MEFKEVKKVKSSKYDEDKTRFTYSVTLPNGEILSVPKDPANRHYAEILKQVQAGTLTIADAD